MCTISPSNTCLCVCLFISLSFVCVYVSLYSTCQSVTLVSHTTCLSFVNVYVGTCPPICHIHVHYFPPLHVCQSVCDILPCTRLSVFFFCICMPVHLPIRHIHTHNVFHMCLCVCVFASICPVYHVHSYVSMYLSATFMYTIRPFRAFLRLSVDLRVFVYVCLIFKCLTLR